MYGRSINGDLVPIHNLDTISFMNVSETMYFRFHPVQSPAEVAASYVPLGTHVQNPFCRPVRHDNVDSFRYRVRSDGSDILRCVRAIVVSVFVGLVSKSPVAKGRRIRRNVNGERGSIVQWNVCVPSFRNRTPTSRASVPVIASTARSCSSGSSGFSSSLH